MSEVIVVRHASGIGNTIRTLVSAMRFHPHASIGTTSGPLRIIFPKLSAPAHAASKVYVGWSLLLTEEERRSLTGNQDFSLTTDDEHGRDFTIPYPVIDFMYERTPTLYMQLFLPNFQKLLDEYIDPRILQRAKDFAAAHKFGAADIASVHIRSWFDHPRRKSNPRFYRYDFFVEKMRQLVAENPNQRFFVACDDIAVTNSLKNNEAFKDRIITFDGIIAHSAYCAANAMEDIMVELLLISMNRTIIGTRYSSFSECAYYFACTMFKREEVRAFVEMV